MVCIWHNIQSTFSLYGISSLGFSIHRRPLFFFSFFFSPVITPNHQVPFSSIPKSSFPLLTIATTTTLPWGLPSFVHCSVPPLHALTHNFFLTCVSQARHSLQFFHFSDITHLTTHPLLPSWPPFSFIFHGFWQLPPIYHFYSYFYYYSMWKTDRDNVRQQGKPSQQVKEKMWMVYYRMKLNKWSSDS